MSREIALSRGLVAIVDDADYDTVMSAGKWYADPSCRTFYARRNFWTPDRRCKSIKMHRFLTGWDLVDHVNGDGLDNRRANLRAATTRTNTFNRGIRTDNKTGRKGVSRSRGLFRAQIQCDGVLKYLGEFEAADDAARVYDVAAIELFGDFARTNFPREDYS